jgi:prepilin-type processing-associated H-X9-DG protein
MAIDLNRGGHGCTKTSGLTLVELMVVVAMTGILTAMMLPALSTAKEKSRRAVCKNNERQIINQLQIFSENEEFLPSCADDKGQYHSIILSDAVFTNLTDYAGSSDIFYCPNVVFGSGPVSQRIPNIGIVIGYSYLATNIAGSAKAPDVTVEPMKMPNTPNYLLVADANFWTPSSASSGYFPPAMKMAPHTPMGAAIKQGTTFTVGLPGDSLASIGAAGGNSAFADGHVEWRTLSQMHTNSASTMTDDAFGVW